MRGCERGEGRKMSAVETLYFGVYIERVAVFPILQTPIMDTDK